MSLKDQQEDQDRKKVPTPNEIWRILKAVAKRQEEAERLSAQRAKEFKQEMKERQEKSDQESRQFKEDMKKELNKFRGDME